MGEKKDNVIVKKSYDFALKVIRLCKALNERKEFVLSKQVLRSATSIGANVHEAVASESKKDFVHKFRMALKEARETLYWLNLLRDAGYISDNLFRELIQGCEEIIKILNSIILTTHEQYL